jgi:hypothetical protein
MCVRISKIDSDGRRVSGSVFDGQRNKVATIEFLCDKTVVATDPPSYQALLSDAFTSSAKNASKPGLLTYWLR